MITIIFLFLIMIGPDFVNLNDNPDPFSPFTAETTDISYDIVSPNVPDELRVTLKVWDEQDKLIATLVNDAIQTTGSQVTNWDGAGITETGIFKYEIWGYRREFAGPTERIPAKKPNNIATPKYGTITAINEPDTVITQSADGNLTVYSRPITSVVEIVQNPFLGSDVTYALGNISVISPAYTYVVSSFYDITAVTPLITPTIVALKYPVELSPDAIRLFRYDPVAQTFLAIGRTIIDPINHILYAELDSLSLIVLMANKDISKPTIQDLALTYQVLNFRLNDDLTGINIPSIKVVLDGQDITDTLTITGETGDLTATVSGQDIFQPWLDTHTMTILAQDRAGNEVIRTISFIAGYAEVTLIVKPEALNINPGVLTAYLKFPPPFGIPTVLEVTLDYAPPENWVVNYEGLPDLELEGPVVEMKFRREVIEQALTERGEVLDTEFILRGQFDDGTALYGQLYNLEGRDTITKIISKETPATGPPEQPSGKGGKNK